MKEMSTSLAKRQFCPDFEEDIENDELKNLAERLKGDSEKETLTNILEWQDRNIQFWWERWPLDLSLKILIPISSLLVLTISLPFLLLLYYSKFLEVFALLIVLIAAFFFVLALSNTTLKIFYLFLSFPFVYLFTSLALRIPVLAQNILPYTLFYMGCLGAIALIMAYLSIRYKMFWREKDVKEKISKTTFGKVVNDTFRLSLPVDKILEYKLAVCRDYAKLTASLLFNVYPDSEVYFITILGHVAAGIKIKNKIYILDQRLPILTTDNWLKKRNKKKAGTYISKLERDPKGRQKVTLDKQKPIIKDPKEDPKINTEKLTEEIAEIFGIEPTSHIDNPNLEIRLHNYEDDEITKYSLIRAIKNRLEREFCDNTDKMSKISINQDKISVKIKEA
jgi:predicted transglutaminase-like protease